VPDNKELAEGREAFKAQFRQDYNALVADKEMSNDPLPTPGEAPAPPTKPTETAEKVAGPKAKTEEPRLAGKYETVEELEKGYNHLLTQATKMSGENQSYREQLEAIQSRRPVTEGQDSTFVQGGSPGAEPRVNPAARTPDWSASGAVKKFSETSGVEPSVAEGFAADIYASVVQVAQQEAQRAAQEAVAPIYAQSRADAYMQQNYPDAVKLAPEISLFLETTDNPVTKETFKNLADAKNIAGAMEYATLAYKNAMGADIEKRLRAESDETAAENADAKKHAGVTPSSPGTPVHAGAKQDDTFSNEDIEALAKKARTGDIHDQKRYRDATVGRMLKSDPNFQAMIKRHQKEFGLS
jgi:hypothetical protein